MAADYDKLFRPHEGMEAPDCIHNLRGRRLITCISL
ncbi:ESX-1 associated ATP-binding protein EpsI N-terminal domain-containing protein [Mycobacterium tuberculosis]